MRENEFLNGVKRLISTPLAHGDEAETRRAGVLNTILWLCLATFALFLLAVPYAQATSGGGLSAVVLLGVLMLLATGGLLALRAGMVRRVARSFALGLWATATLVTIAYGGVTSAETGAYLAVIVAAGLLSGAPAMFAFAALSLATLTVMFIAGQAGYMPQPYLEPTPLADFAISAGNVIIVGGMLYRFLTSRSDALVRARKIAGELAETNRALNAMRDSLEEQVAERTRNAEVAWEEAEHARERLEAQMWKTAGLAALHNCMRGEQDIRTLANHVIAQLCQYLPAPVGTLYLLESDVLRMMGSYACAPAAGAPREFRSGEALLGQAALEQQVMLVRDVPSGYLTVASALGSTAPQQILIAPFMYAGRTIGVVEIGVLHEFTVLQLEFFGSAMESIAIAFNTAAARARMDELLQQTQRQAEELQAQEEELRAINEELQAQAEQLRGPAAGQRRAQAAFGAGNR